MVVRGRQLRRRAPQIPRALRHREALHQVLTQKPKLGHGVCLFVGLACGHHGPGFTDLVALPLKQPALFQRLWVHLIDLRGGIGLAKTPRASSRQQQIHR
jgi:hypothetical protein